MLALGATALTACSSSGSFVESTPVTPQTTQTFPASATVARGAITQASIVVPVGATTTVVAIGPSGGPLVSVRLPADAGQLPTLRTTSPAGDQTTGHVVVGLTAGQGGPSVNSTTALTVLLNPDVEWSVALTGGASRESIDALGGHITAVRLGKTSKATVALPASAGVTKVDEVGGVSELDLTAPSPEVASVTAQAGAGTITIDGAAHSGIAAGTTINQPGYPTAKDRLVVHLEAGASQVTISSGAAG